MRVLSLGGGVQSTTLLLMALIGEFEPLDAVIFADTGDEPRAVYAHIAGLESRCATVGLPFYRVTSGHLGADTLAGRTPGKRFPSLPLYIANKKGEAGKLRRQCTTTYKVEPILRQIRVIAGLRPRQRWKGEPVEDWLGISTDEVVRMRDSREPWIRLRYPLVERRMRRADCITWLQDHNYPVPPKSACIFCPFHDNTYWRALKATSPDEFARAVAFDHRVRRLQYNRIAGDVFVHRSLLPLDEVDLSTREERGQLSLWDEECEGHCGL